MAIAPTPTVETAPVFPADAVAEAIRDELVVAIRATAARSGKSIPAAVDRLLSMSYAVDSLTVVELLCVLDDILPFEVGESAVRPGGYDSINEAVTDVVRRTEKQWDAFSKSGEAR